MSSSFLIKLLSEKLSNPVPRDNQRTAIVGIGAELNGDDGAGILVVRKLVRKVPKSSQLLILEGATVPESITSPLRRFAPGIVFLIDSADLLQVPGTIQVIAPGEISGASFSSHSMPLSMLAGFLQHELGCDVIIIGIQPETIEFGEKMSPACRLAVKRLVLAFSQVLTTKI